MTPRPLTLLAVLLLVPAAACSDDPADDDASATTATTEPAGDEICDALQAVRDFDDESQAVLEESLPPLLAATPEEADAAFSVFLEQFQPFVEENLADLLANYDTLAALVPEEIGDDVVELRDFTASFAGGLADATSRDEVEALFTGDPEQTTAVAEATLRIDEFSRDTCDIVIAD